MKCKQKKSISKRKNVNCEGCKYLKKVRLGTLKQYRWICTY